MTISGPGGQTTCSVGVSVALPPPPPPSDAPTCTLSASPTSIDSGSATTLTWATSNAATFSIDHGVATTTPASGGSISSEALTTDTTFTGTATSATGVVATCSAPVSINHGGGGSAPSCSLAVSPTSYVTGNSATLSWGGEQIANVDIDNGIATATTSPGSIVVSPTSVGNYTYTGTFHAQNGQTLTCAATLAVTGGAGGGVGGGGGGAGGGGGGGGGSPSPVITLAALPHMSVQPLAYLYLSQIPYTGLELGPVSTVLYWLALIGFALALAYLVLFYVVPSVHRSMQLFGSRVSILLNAQERLVVSTPSAKIAPVPPAPEAASPAAHEYSTYDGFKSFANNGALSVEDIVKGLSRKSLAPNAEPIYEQVEPIYEQVEPITVAASTGVESTAIPAHSRSLIVPLIEGDRAAVFAGLRKHVQEGGAPEQLLSTMVGILDDVYRARMDGASCDADIARRSARLSMPILEKLIASLTTAVDSSYSDGVTGAKLALIRALSVLGA